jgi:hypothetical protein
MDVLKLLKDFRAELALLNETIVALQRLEASRSTGGAVLRNWVAETRAAARKSKPN